MPTKTGRPRVGESIFMKDGKTLIGKVLEVERGQIYSVKVQKPGSKFASYITEFEFWKNRHGWVIK